MHQLWDGTVMVLQFVFGHLVFFNLIFAIIIVFFQRRDPRTVWTWLMLLFFSDESCYSLKYSRNKPFVKEQQA